MTARAPPSAPLARTARTAVDEPVALRAPTPVARSSLDVAIATAREELLRRQSADGRWQFELEADCTIPAEYIMMMHFLGDIDAALEAKPLARPSTAAGRCITAATSTSAAASRRTSP
jgi:hypothetical protein